MWRPRPLVGTTTVGIRCVDGIVFATDTRATAGFFVAHRKTRKIYRIDDHLAMTIAGVVADCQKLADLLRAYASLYKVESREPVPIMSAARIAANILHEYRLFPFIAFVLIGGVDRGGPSLYNLDFVGSINSDRFLAEGSGSPIAYGILETEFKDGMTTSEGLNLAMKAVASAIRRDIGSGDGINAATVTKDGYKEISEEERKKILKELGIVASL